MVRDDEEGHGPGVRPAPAVGSFEGAATTDHGPDTSVHPVEVFLVRSGRLAEVSVVVCPRPAEDPVMQPLAALASPLSGPSSGPVMNPSTDIVIPASTFVMSSPFP